MSQIYKCDFCGTITDEIAGRVIIQTNDTHLMDAIYEQEGIDCSQRNYNLAMDGIVKDACTSCITNFITKPVKIKVLEHIKNDEL